jgi:hypothetical protein
MFGKSVRRTVELDRILGLPRRTDEDYPEDLVQRMTELLRAPGGTQTLRAIQAKALYDLGHVGGLFGPISVGNGKTLILFLSVFVLNAMFGTKKFLVVVPANLLKKTARDFASLREHWRFPKDVQLQLVSYDVLGTIKQAAFLEEFGPEAILFDEVQRAKNKHASRGKRFVRYFREHPETRCVALTGTIMRRSLHDFAHILRWCLKENTPLPATYMELEEWAYALDENVNELNQYEVGALSLFANGETDLNEVRRGFQRRLTETQGVVATKGSGEAVDCELYINALRYDLAPEMDAHFDKLRNLMRTPDDWVLMQAVDVWRHAKELALGLFYAWDPRPPEDWRRARKEWAAFVRETLQYSRTLDSELQVVNAVDAGRLPKGEEPLREWRRLKTREPVFVPNVVPRWCDDSALKVCAKWMKQPGIVWTGHELFARRLAQLTGCKYYGAKGLADDGEFVDDAPNDKAIIVSIDANREGRNLQLKWWRNLVTDPPEGADVWEQLLGRTHRPLQQNEEVVVDVLLGCREHLNAIRRAVSTAEALRDMTGADQKLLTARLDWPDVEETDAWDGARW